MYESLWLLLGLILLVKGSDIFVESSARLAKRIGVSDLVIGLTFVAIGTSIPELSSSIIATMKGYPEIVTGTLIGSNIANIALIVAAAAIMRNIHTQKKMFERDGFILMLSVIIFMWFIGDGSISMVEGFILLALYFIYAIFLIETRSSRVRKYKFRDFLDFFVTFKYVTSLKKLTYKSKEPEKPKQDVIRLLGDVAFIAGSGLAIVFGAKYLIDGAVWLANVLSLPRAIIGLSVMSIGTSLPELTVSLRAAKKGLGGLVIGTALGSNIARTFLIFGLCSMISPITISEISINYVIPIMAFFTALFVYLIRKETINRKWGIALILLYIGFIVMAFAQGWY